MAKQVLDMYELYNLVVAQGGLVQVINKKLWQEIIKGLKLPSSINISRLHSANSVSQTSMYIFVTFLCLLLPYLYLLANDTLTCAMKFFFLVP